MFESKPEFAWDEFNRKVKKNNKKAILDSY